MLNGFTSFLTTEVNLCWNSVQYCNSLAVHTRSIEITLLYSNLDTICKANGSFPFIKRTF